MAWRLGLRVQLAGQSGPLDEPAPPLVAAMLMADVPAGGKRAVSGPVGLCPLPRQHLRLPARPVTPGRIRLRARGLLTWPAAAGVRGRHHLPSPLTCAEPSRLSEWQ